MSYKVYRSQRFNKDLSKFDYGFKSVIDKIEGHIAENPYSGEPLGVKWFREKRHEKYRIYYLIYEEIKVVFMIAISEKKNQQKVIDTIWVLLDLLYEW